MLLEGKTLAATIRQSLPERAEAVRRKLGRALKLYAYGNADDYAAYVYLHKEVQAAQKLGVETKIFPLSDDMDAAAFLEMLTNASKDPAVDAILIARPLPPQLAACGYERVLAPEKDIDGMSCANMGNLFLCKTWQEVEQLPGFVPCTARAVVRLLQYHHIPLEGVEAAVIGRSPTVGRPLAHLLTCQNATVKICHTKTQDLKHSLAGAQLICCAAGKAGLLRADMVCGGSTVIDIATNLSPDGALCGDADSAALLAKGCKVSPVPGGVGPVTLACLLENIILSGERKI